MIKTVITPRRARRVVVRAASVAGWDAELVTALPIPLERELIEHRRQHRAGVDIGDVGGGLGCAG